jgi:hypothetical protein
MRSVRLSRNFCFLHDIPPTNPLRSQVGESFRPVISALAVRATYGVAGAYVVPTTNATIASTTPILTTPAKLSASELSPPLHPP